MVGFPPEGVNGVLHLYVYRSEEPWSIDGAFLVQFCFMGIIQVSYTCSIIVMFLYRTHTTFSTQNKAYAEYIL